MAALGRKLPLRGNRPNVRKPREAARSGSGCLGRGRAPVGAGASRLVVVVVEPTVGLFRSARHWSAPSFAFQGSGGRLRQPLFGVGFGAYRCWRALAEVDTESVGAFPGRRRSRDVEGGRRCHCFAATGWCVSAWDSWRKDGRTASFHMRSDANVTPGWRSGEVAGAALAGQIVSLGQYTGRVGQAIAAGSAYFPC